MSLLNEQVPMACNLPTDQVDARPTAPLPAPAPSKTDSGCRLSPRDAALIAALCNGASRAEAAKAAGVSLRTVARRMADEAFRQGIAEWRTVAFEQAAARLGAIASRAVATLEELLGESFSPMVRLGSARAVLELGNRYFESAELAARVAVLEKIITEGRQ